MTTITIPDDVPHVALAEALAYCGLILDGRQRPDGHIAAVWADQARCQSPGCNRQPAVKLGPRVWCAAHALAAARESAAI
jgi:hypothetical protein